MSGSVAAEPHRRDHLQFAATTVLLAAIAFGLVLTLTIAWNRSYQVDEIEHIHAAYNMREGRVLYRDFWQGHNPMLYALLAPVIDTGDPVTSYHFARIVSLTILLSLLAVIVYCGWCLAGASGALASLALALFHTTLIERGIEVRPDGGLALCIAAALAVELGCRRGPTLRYSLQALILGTGFLFTQKAVFVTAVFGCLWLWSAIRDRRFRVVLQPVGLWFLPFAMALLIMLPFGCARQFLEQAIVDAFFAGAGGRANSRFGPMSLILHEGARNQMFLLLAFAGVALLLRRRTTRFPALLAIALVVALWANPFPWPYVHLSVLPVLALAGGYALATAARGRAVVTVLGVALAMLTSMPRLLQDAAEGTELQFAMLREIQRVTEPNDRLFDLDGLYFRPDAYEAAYAMSEDLISRYKHGQFPRMIPELRRHACAGVLLNYRTGQLIDPERAFLRTHYVHYWRNLYLPGVTLAGAADGTRMSLDVLQRRVFRYDGDGAIRVDGMPFRRGLLEAGLHEVAIERSSASASRLIVATPEPVRPQLPATAAMYPAFD
jgi:hypothetical protein